ncbi:MAG: hypothetical protein ACXVHX_12335 [Solirubrobacteraceae bacterium]
MSQMITPSPRAARLTLALVIAVRAVAALSTSPAAAGVVTHAYKAAVRTPGLSAAERRAISVKSIAATADDSLGLLVSVQLQGNVERSLGRGGLANGVLALALVPKASGRTPSGLIDQGGGFTRTGFPLLGPRGKPAGRGSVDLIGAERVTRMLSCDRVQVIRAANRVIFYVADLAVGRIAGSGSRCSPTAPSDPARSRPALVRPPGDGSFTPSRPLPQRSPSIRVGSPAMTWIGCAPTSRRSARPFSRPSSDASNALGRSCAPRFAQPRCASNARRRAPTGKRWSMPSGRRPAGSHISAGRSLCLAV